MYGRESSYHKAVWPEYDLHYQKTGQYHEKY